MRTSLVSGASCFITKVVNTCAVSVCQPGQPDMSIPRTFETKHMNFLVSAAVVLLVTMSAVAADVINRDMQGALPLSINTSGTESAPAPGQSSGPDKHNVVIFGATDRLNHHLHIRPGIRAPRKPSAVPTCAHPHMRAAVHQQYEQFHQQHQAVHQFQAANLLPRVQRLQLPTVLLRHRKMLGYAYQHAAPPASEQALRARRMMQAGRAGASKDQVAIEHWIGIQIHTRNRANWHDVDDDHDDDNDVHDDIHEHHDHGRGQHHDDNTEDAVHVQNFMVEGHDAVNKQLLEELHEDHEHKQRTVVNTTTHFLLSG